MLQIILLVLLVLTACSPQPSMTVSDAWVRASLQDGTSAAYMRIDNGTTSTERLIRVTTDAADVAMLHETRLENGVARMDHLTGIDIPAGASITFEPLGLHVMFMGLRRELIAGESVELTLTFESGTTLTAKAEIRPLSE